MEEKYRQALIRGAELMIEHGLNDWKVKLHSKRRILADCNNSTRVIRYSKHFLKVATKEQLEGVTLHEIAHALVGPGHGHDNVFKRKVYEINPVQGYSNSSVGSQISTHRYNLCCPECGNKGRSSINRRWICGHCSKQGKRITLEVSENILQITAW